MVLKKQLGIIQMKILFVSSGNSKLGISPIIKNQGESLQDKNIEINYFTIIGKGLKNYLIHIFLLKKHTKENNYDIIHAHFGLCGIVAQLARNKEKLVVSFMGDDIIGSVESSGKYTLFSKLLVSINKIFLKKYDFIITKSQNLAQKTKIKSRIEIIPNGVDFKKFKYVGRENARTILDINSEKKIIIFVSNPDRKEKNYKLAQDALYLMNDKNIELISVYSIDQEKLNLYYSAADLLILTSYHEGSPNVIKEAMACNCPIVSTDVGDVRWIIGKTKGCDISSFEPQNVTEKIRSALDFSEKIGRTKGHERLVELGLDSETVAKKIITIYKSVLNS